MSHKRIRRVSLDQFYALVTGEEDAFYQLCMVLPEVIERVVQDADGIKVPNDTVLEELRNIATQIGKDTEPIAMAMAVYMLGFNTYYGFKDYFHDEKKQDDAMLKRLYEYARRVK